MVRRYLSSIVCIACFLFLAMPVMAGPAVDQLRKRIDRLENELKELKELLGQQQQAREEEKKRIESIEEKGERVSPRVLSKFKFKPYGFIKLDAAYDDSRTDYGNFVCYVRNESIHKDDNEFNMTARQTRIGMRIIAPDFDEWKTMGRIEFDFYGDGSQRHENKAEPMLRHAYLEMKKGNFSLLAGQTSDLISPLFPNTLNYTVGWAAGNIGYRRAQVRLSYNYPLNDNTRLTTAFAIARTAGTANEDLDLDLKNDGEDAGFPTFQGRIGLATKVLTNKASVFGISGHYGKEEIDFPTGQRRAKSWSVNGDFNIPLSEYLSIKGEMFLGYNLDDYFGGILQGVNSTTQEIIKARGGWAQLSYDWSSKLKYKAGLGIDDPSNNDLSAGMRGKNSFYFANVTYNIIPPVTVGLEYSYWNTEYLDESDGTDNRLQASVIYNW